MTAPVDYQRLSDVYDAQRTIIVMHRPLNPKSKYETPEDKPYPVTELAADITPYALMLRVADNDLECNRDDITVILQIEDDGRSITNITKAIFKQAQSVEARNYRCDPEGDGQQIGWDRSKEARLARAL